jgi:hypothetical protein
MKKQPPKHSTVLNGGSKNAGASTASVVATLIALSNNKMQMAKRMRTNSTKNSLMMSRTPKSSLGSKDLTRFQSNLLRSYLPGDRHSERVS